MQFTLLDPVDEKFRLICCAAPDVHSTVRRFLRSQIYVAPVYSQVANHSLELVIRVACDITN